MKTKTMFFCTECGNETARWSGQCPACGQWNTLTEAPVNKASKAVSAVTSDGASRNVPVLIDEIAPGNEIRFSTGVDEFDRVLGGGAVRGSMVLVGGAPGIGKSTLLLQICGNLSGTEKTLYVSGEESQHQIKMRAERMGVRGDKLYILTETVLGEIIEAVETLEPDVLIVDSIQTIYDPDITSSPGSVGQVRECAMSLMRTAKSRGITVFVVGHVNKDGAIAGPKVLEHMVDCVLYFEGERSLSYRILRAAKNRFGSTNEIGVFEMTEKCLRGVDNPSEMLLSGRPDNAPGTCVACVMEGTRPILAEVQALVAPTVYPSARRTANGVDYNRAALVLAVLEKRGGLNLGTCDSYINVIGGLQISEPAADLAMAMAIASSHRDIPVGGDLAAVGEIGLTGEIRSVRALDQRLAEIKRLGFTRCAIPAHIRGEVKAPEGLELISVRNVRDAVRIVLGD